LSHLNELGNGTFNLDYFEHKAFFNAQDSRIEMHLVSKIDQVVNIFSKPLAFKKDEHIVTEYSYKFDPNQFLDFAAQAGFEGKHVWQDEGSNFALFWLEGI
jgi:uncharacterized SAM-dependent methyltransferase